MDLPAYCARLAELASQARSASELYLRAQSLYFRSLQHTELRPKLVNHCANLCVLTPDQLRRVFGAHRMILSVRDPRAVYCSLRCHRPVRDSRKTIPAFCRAWEKSVRCYHLGEPSVVSFRFEDLVDDPDKVMRSVSQELGIAFDECLLTPTLLGRATPANTSFSRAEGIDPSAAAGWRGHLELRERVLIEGRLGALMQRLGYS
jgi:hypothetical protein